MIVVANVRSTAIDCGRLPWGFARRINQIGKLVNGRLLTTPTSRHQIPVLEPRTDQRA